MPAAENERQQPEAVESARTFLVDAREHVERVIREETLVVERVAEHLRDRGSRDGLVVLQVVLRRLKPQECEWSQVNGLENAKRRRTRACSTLRSVVASACMPAVAKTQ